MAKVEGVERQQQGSVMAPGTRSARGRPIWRRLLGPSRRTRSVLVAGLALCCVGLVGVAGVATITEFLIPTAGSAPQGITAGPDGALWFTELIGNKIGNIVLDPVWSEVPGGGLTPSSPAAVLEGSTRHLFVRGSDSRLYLNSRVGVTWSGWSEVPGGGLTLSQPAAVRELSLLFSTLRLFVQGTDTRLYANSRTFNLLTSSTSWSGWSEVPGGGKTPSGPEAVLDGGDARLVVQGIDNHIYTTLAATPPYTEVPGGGLTPSSPAAVLEGTTLHLFVRGTDSRLYLNSRTGVTWSGWSEVPGGGFTPNQPAAVLDSSGILRLFVQGTDTRLYVNSRSGGSWSGWSEVPGGGQTPTGPEAVLDGGLVRLVIRGIDNRIYTSTPAWPTPTAVGVAVGSAASATIGPAGGSLRAPDGNLTLTIPAGALATNTVIGIQPLTNMAHGKIGAAYRLTPAGQTFQQPVTLTSRYTDPDLLGTAVEVLGAAFQTAEGYWQWAGDATFDSTARTVSISSSHFSEMSLVKGLQIRPPSKTVKPKKSVNLEVVGCYNPGSPDPRGYNCDLGGLAILNPVSEWSVTGVVGDPGTVSGRGPEATYTAPAKRPNPNTVAVSARVDRGAKGKTLVVSNITIAEDSWTGTASSGPADSFITSTAQVTWNLEGTVDNVSVFNPTGIVSTVMRGCSIDPSSHIIDPSTDGVLSIDFNANPPTYRGWGESHWSAIATCPPFGPTDVLNNAPWFRGSLGPLANEAVGLVSPDGVTIEGSSAFGAQTFNWKFTRDE